MPMTRRHFTSLAIAAPAIATPAGLTAQVLPGAESHVRTMVSEIRDAIAAGSAGSDMTEAFEAVFNRYADMPTIARYTLGASARRASRGELARFSDAFTRYIARKYGAQFREFTGGDITISGRRERGNGMVIVDGTARVPGRRPAGVAFHVSDRSGEIRIFNVVVEGVNLLTTERREITARLDRAGGDIDALADAL